MDRENQGRVVITRRINQGFVVYKSEVSCKCVSLGVLSTLGLHYKFDTGNETFAIKRRYIIFQKILPA